MKTVSKLAIAAGGVLAAGIVGIAGWLAFAPPDLIRLGTGYAAKIVCSNVFIAERDAGEVLALDVQAPGHPLLGYISVHVDREKEIVSAALLGLFGTNRAVHRDGLGCASVPSGDPRSVPALAAYVARAPGASPETGLWPEGSEVDPADPEIAALLADESLTGPGMRAVVVVREGRIVGERYGDGFDLRTPLLGWSMTKTVTAVLIGTLSDRLALDRQDLMPGWNDARTRIALHHLMSMTSGLAFNEDYGSVADVTRMLYLERDMAAFAASMPLVAPPGERFSYSSGTSLILSRIWQDTFDDAQAALAWPRDALFGPIGMDSAVLEIDASGTFVGSSYLYATGRDWARFGQFLLQGGEWDEERILPEGFVSWMREPVAASGGDYGQGQLWLDGPGEGGALPDDTFWLRGHDGQSVAVIPSRGLVVVRMGLTPSNEGYSPTPLVAALAALGD